MSSEARDDVCHSWGMTAQLRGNRQVLLKLCILRIVKRSE